MSDPAAGLQPLKLSAMEGINRNYAQLPDTISRKLASRGYGSSGKMGGALYGTELARMGDLSDLEGKFAGMVADRQNQGASLGEQLLALASGKDVTNTGPSNMAGDALMSGGNALNNLSTLLMLSKVLKG
jgi:hypothetical protein